MGGQDCHQKHADDEEPELAQFSRAMSFVEGCLCDGYERGCPLGRPHDSTSSAGSARR